MVPEGVTAIGEEAFFDCTDLTQIILPEGLKVVKEAAFDGCTALTKVILPDPLSLWRSKAARVWRTPMA